jgi:hypothetical protein
VGELNQRSQKLARQIPPRGVGVNVTPHCGIRRQASHQRPQPPSARRALTPHLIDQVQREMPLEVALERRPALFEEGAEGRDSPGVIP